MRIWFWAWVLVAAIVALVATATRDRYSAPWATGAAAAAGLEALRVPIGWQWAAFFAISAAVFLAFNRQRRARGQHEKRSMRR